MNDMLPKKIAIVGASLAGARAAEALRLNGFNGEVLLIGEEPRRPYERPPLSKEVLLNDNVQPQWLHAMDFYSDKSIELITGCRVVSLTRQPAEKFKLKLSDGAVRHADTVLLATGGRPRKLGGCPAGQSVHYIRTWEDSMQLRSLLKADIRVVVIGSGFIGAEVASTALARGCHVTIVEALPRLFPSIPSTAVALDMAHRFINAGAVSEIGRAVAKVTKEGQQARVHLVNGTEIAADLVVAGIGIELESGLATMVGAEVGRGVMVDPQFRTTIPGLYAAGDVCTIRDDFGNESHVEHWKAAQEQGVAAALSMLGLPVPQLSAPWCWSDQLGQRIEVAGSPRASDDQVVRRDEKGLCVFHLRGGRLIGLVSLNAMRAMRMGVKLLENAARPDPEQLADPSVPVNKVKELA